MFVTAFDRQRDLADLSPAALRVLATAAAMFFEQGVMETSVRDLTRACGLSPGALYNHFPSKDEVLFRLVAHGHARMKRRVEREVRRTDGGPIDRFSAYVRAYVGGHVEQPELAQLVRREYVHLSAERYHEIVGVRRALRRRLTALIEAGAGAGSFELLGDPVAQTLMVLDMCSHTSDWYDRSRESDDTVIVDRYVRGALRLVGAAGAR